MPLRRTPASLTADLKVELPPRPDMGDLAVGCFAVAKAQKTNPAAAAQAIAAAFVPGSYLVAATAAGAFVNFRADRAATFRWVIDAALSGSLIPKTIGAGQTIVIDYGSPNISKHLAYHHIRGTTIGHSIAQLHRALGYRVVGINFLGDWGTTHGMLLAACERWGHEVTKLDITALNGLYVRFRKALEENPALEAVGRAWFKRLEDGDTEARALWQKFRDVSWAEYASIYDLLGIAYDLVRGESAYAPAMPEILARLTETGLLVESEGAQVVHLDDEKKPMLLRTGDGTTLYATRDVAAAEYYWREYAFTRLLYVVDRGQSLHFRQLKKLLGKMGHTWAERTEHIPYGLVRVDGKRTASRLGNVVLMREVFAIAEDEVRAGDRLAQRNAANLPPESVATVARQVGIGAIVFANLAPQREKDIDFDLEQAVSLEGDSGPYLQYSHARCASLARKAAADDGQAVTGDRGRRHLSCSCRTPSGPSRASCSICPTSWSARPTRASRT